MRRWTNQCGQPEGGNTLLVHPLHTPSAKWSAARRPPRNFPFYLFLLFLFTQGASELLAQTDTSLTLAFFGYFYNCLSYYYYLFISNRLIHLHKSARLGHHTPPALRPRGRGGGHSTFFAFYEIAVIALKLQNTGIFME